MRPHRRKPTRLLCPWDSPGKNTGVGCHFLLQCVKVKSLSRVRPSVTPWTAAYQAPPSMGFSRQEYWSGVPLPSPIKCYSMHCSHSTVNLLQKSPWQSSLLSVSHNQSPMCRFFSLLNHMIKLLFLFFSSSVKSDLLQPHGLKHTSFPVLNYLLEFAKSYVL